MSVNKLDAILLRWLQAIIEDPSRADAYRVDRRGAEPDEHALAAALAAERYVAELEQDVSGRLATLALLTGAVQLQAAQELNARNEELEADRAERDRLSAACRVTVSESALTIAPQDALARAVLDAIRAMVDADTEPEETFSVLLPVPGGIAEHYDVPLSWKAWQAALAVLNVRVTVAPISRADLPRWVTELQLPFGLTVNGTSSTYLGSTWG